VQAARYEAPGKAETWASLKVPVLWQSAIAGAGGSFGGGPGAGYGAPGGSAPGGCCASDGFAAPYVAPASHRGFRNVFLIVDMRRMGDRSLGLISDYVAMLALSQPKSLGTCQALPSITDLFADCGGPAPDGLTTADAAFLTALYQAKRSSTADIADRMAGILGSTRVASR
jgi:hypothetical protein